MIRRQLSLYLSPPASTLVDSIRRVVDPVQASLIPAHVTLCRDDEVPPLPPKLHHPLLVLHFGRAVQFHDHGILLPCIVGLDSFASLRASLGAYRPLDPHITLAHPRNPRAPGNSLDLAHTLPLPLVVELSSIHSISQPFPSSPWQVDRVVCFT